VDVDTVVYRQDGATLQGPNEVRWHLVQEASLAPPMFKTGLMGANCIFYCMEESTCDIVGIFRCPGNCVPLPSSHYALATLHCAIIRLNS